MSKEKTTCFTAGIVKGLFERSDARRHFGSLLNFTWHLNVAAANGLLTAVEGKTALTDAGRAYYADKRLAELEDTRAYFWTGQRDFEMTTTPEAA